MPKSLTYHLTMLVLKLKGVKKLFSQDPVDYKTLRKEDVYNPRKGMFGAHTVSQFSVLKTQVTQIKQSGKSKKLLLFVHGGGFIAGPGEHHWDSIKQIIKQKELTVWMCNYPKAPEHQISEISANIDDVYKTALNEYDASQITLVGDSVGGTLASALTQRLIVNQQQVPAKLILISPVMDASLSNPAIDEVDKKDPMLSKKGILSAKKMCAENKDLSSPMISPIHGSFKGFPSTLLFLAEHDITYPDQELAIQKLNEAGVDYEVVTGEQMPHIWPLLPVMREAKQSLQYLISQL